MKLLFIAPQSNLSSHAELSRIASGNRLEIIDGLLDRAGLERALREPADIVHFCGHGGKHLLELNDGLIDSADLVSMLDRQHGAKLFFVNACDSLAVASAIHNALHAPVVAHDKPIDDKAAVRFAERFYREYKRSNDVGHSFEAARETLMRLYPGEANTPVLLNGDMASRKEISDCMDYLKGELSSVFEHFNTRLDSQDKRLAAIEDNMRDITRPHSGTKLIVALIVVLVVLQAATPVLNGLLVR
jgi:hypothetical protein